MPTYDTFNPSGKKAVDALYRDKINLLLNTSIAVNNLRMDAGTLPADASLLDAKYADLQNRLGLLEKEMTQVYANQLDITPPAQAVIDSITTLSPQVDQLINDQAVASAALALANQVLTAVTVAATPPGTKS